MAKPVTDDTHAIDPISVACVTKPDGSGETWWLFVTLTSGTAMTLWFTTQDGRDSFYKALVDAMSQ